MLAELLNAVINNLLYFVLHLRNGGSFPQPLSSDEEKEMFEKMKSGDEEARKKLIEHNLRLVAHVTKKYYSQTSDSDDLISIGTIGLIKAINSFDYSKGTRLATYAARCIENEVLMNFRSRKKSSQDISMSEPIDTDGDGNPLTFGDVIFVEDDIADEIDSTIKHQQLYSFVENLRNKREQQIIILRYGLYNGKPMTQREVAKRMDISRSYVSRIEKRVLDKLRRNFGIK